MAWIQSNCSHSCDWEVGWNRASKSLCTLDGFVVQKGFRHMALQNSLQWHGVLQYFPLSHHLAVSARNSLAPCLTWISHSDLWERRKGVGREATLRRRIKMVTLSHQITPLISQSLWLNKWSDNHHSLEETFRDFLYHCVVEMPKLSSKMFFNL